MNEHPNLKMASPKYRLASLLIVIVTLSFGVVSFAQNTPSDTEMKEVLRMLIEREVPRSMVESNVVVLLGPNVRSQWIPEVSGFSIRQLSYDEQKKVPEYYDLSSSFTGRSVEVALTKGNYCRKAGRQYEFRRETGTWKSKAIGYVESTAGTELCEGCAVGSGAIYTVKNQFRKPELLTSNERARATDLRLSGVIERVSCARDADYIRCEAALKLSFTNISSTPLIMLQPIGEYKFWHGANTLALSEKESRDYSYVYSSGAWPHVDEGPMYRKLADLLDQPNPPADVTRILKVGESWSWTTAVKFHLKEGNSCNQHVGVEIGWQEIKRRSEPMWLTLSYEIWPFNVENFKPDLGATLRKRWEKHGILYLDDEKLLGRYSQAYVTSEPIKLDLSRTELSP